MVESLKQGLTEEGHTVAVATTGLEALALTDVEQFDVVALDVMLPGLDGLEVARRMRANGDRTPILMLTARDTAGDIIAGLDAGADDYVVKPFSFAVLLARLRAVSRRGPVVQGTPLSVGDLRLDQAMHDIRRGGKALSLTRTEYSLLEFLMRRAGRVVPRQVLIEGVWSHDREIEDNTLDAFVRLLRQKMEAGGRPRLLHTVRGVGYVLREEPET